jgi:hypothetical protein
MIIGGLPYQGLKPSDVTILINCNTADAQLQAWRG